MSLFSPGRFDAYVGTLKAANVVRQWDAHVAKVGGKVFALCGDTGEHITFKVTETSFEGLTAIAGIAQAPYFAKRAWVSISKDAMSDSDLKAYIAASYGIIAARLTRKVKAELEIGESGGPASPRSPRRP